MKRRTTQRLFYKKFPFKARLEPKWTVSAHTLSASQISVANSDREGSLGIGFSYRFPAKEVGKALALQQFFEQYNKEEIRFRVEGKLTIFFKDLEILKKLEAQFPQIVDEFWEPANEVALEHMLSEVRVEVKKKLTHDCRYKVYLRGRMSNISAENRKSFVNLYKRHKGQFVIPCNVQNDFEKPSWGFYTLSYFYVKDSKYLLMAQMILQPVIKEIVKIVTIEELNQKEIEHAE